MAGVLRRAKVFMVYVVICSLVSVISSRRISTEASKQSSWSSTEQIFQKTVKETQMECSAFVNRLANKGPKRVKTFKPMVIDNSTYSPPVLINCTQKQRVDVLRDNLPYITSQYHTVLAFENHIGNCIEQNDKMNAGRQRERQSLTRELNKLIRHGDRGTSKIRDEMKNMASSFRPHDDAVNRSAMTYCSSANSQQELRERIIAVVLGLRDHLKVMRSTTVKAYGMPCGRPRPPASPVRSNDDEAPTAKVPAVVVVVLLLIVVLLIVDIMFHYVVYRRISFESRVTQFVGMGQLKMSDVHHGDGPHHEAVLYHGDNPKDRDDVHYGDGPRDHGDLYHSDDVHHSDGPHHEVELYHEDTPNDSDDVHYGDGPRDHGDLYHSDDDVTSDPLGASLSDGKIGETIRILKRVISRISNSGETGEACVSLLTEK